MGKIKEIHIDKFNGGIAFDDRAGAANQYSRSLNFDIFKKPSTLSPIRSYEDDITYGGGTIKASDLQAFGNTGASIIGLGKKNDGTGFKIYNKVISAAAWTARLASDGSAAESANSPLPSFYIRQPDPTNGSTIADWYVVNVGGFASIGKLDQRAPGYAINDGVQTLLADPSAYNVFKNTAILGQDGAVYIADFHNLYKTSSTATVSVAFAVSGGTYIMSMCRYGTYLALATYNTLSMTSQLLLWDYADSQATEVVELGEGKVWVMENINGTLVCVIDKFINSTTFGSLGNGTGTMVIKGWNGGIGAPTLMEIQAASSTTACFGQDKFVKNNTLFFYAKIPTDSGGTTFDEGIWAFGQRVAGGPWALSLHRELPGTYENSFYGLGDYFYFPCNSDGSVKRTSSTEAYTLTSYYHSLHLDGGDSTLEKQFRGIQVSFETLTSGQTVVVKYRKDGATSWTTLNPVPAIAVGQNRAFYKMDGNFKEVQFRVETTNGSKPNGLTLKYEELTDGNS